MTRRGLIITIIIIVIIIALALIFYFNLRETPERDQSIISQPTFTEFPEITPAAPAPDLLPVTGEELVSYQNRLQRKNFSPDGRLKAVFVEEEKGNLLNIVDAKSGLLKNQIVLNLEGVEVFWQKPDQLLLLEKAAAAVPGSLWQLDLKNRRLTALEKGERGLLLNWSADGQTVLKFSLAAGQTGQLTLTDANQQTVLQLPWLTLPNKCALTEEKIVCALPQFLPPGTILPDHYLQQRFLSQDQIIMAEIKTAAMEIIYDPEEEKLDANDLLIKEGWLYFTNRYDNKVYKMELK